MLSIASLHRALLGSILLTLPAAPIATAQMTGSPATITHVAGTVQAISGSAFTLKTDTGDTYAIQVPDGTRLLQIPPGAKDLSAAKPFDISTVAAGDRILVNGALSGSANSLTAVRVVLMKETAIADLHASEMADWQHRGSGGLVKSVNPAANTLSISSAGHAVTIQLKRTTILRRYAPDSVAFENAVPGTLSQVQPGDQLRVRGDRSADGLTITADEIVSGSFLNIAGPLTAIDAAASTITVKDLTTKRTIVVHITGKTQLRELDARAAAFMAMRAGNAAKTGTTSAASAQAAAAAPRFDPSQLLQRLPAITLADLHSGAAVMLVASSPDASANSVTAITLLSGVEPILSATPSGGRLMQLSPFSMSAGGADMPDVGGGQ